VISPRYPFVATLLAGLILPVIHESAHAQDQKSTSLTVEQAKEIVAGKNVELLQSVTELSVEVAQVLTQFSKSDLRLPRVQTITPEVAKEIVQTKVTLSLGLTTITPEVARALATRTKGMLALDGLRTISVEVARELAQFRGKLTLNGLTTLSPEVARELAKHKSKLTLTHLTEISDEAAEALSQHGATMLLNGLTSLTSASLTATILRSNDGFAKFSKVQTISDDVAKVLAEYRGTKPIELPGLTKLSDRSASLLRGNDKVVLPPHLRK
jgi:D-alanyl-D-alanine dipeptidase